MIAVIIVVVVVGGTRLSEHTIASYLYYTKIDKFTSWWDPPQLSFSQYPSVDFRSMNSLRGWDPGCLRCQS